MLGLKLSWRLVAGLSAAAVAVALPLTLWVASDKGSKEAELGSSLLSGVVVGLALLLAERLFTRAAIQRDINSALLASTTPEPAKDTPQPQVATPLPPLGDTQLHAYDVTYAGSQRDTSRLDAQQVRLRVLRDGEYFQFVAVPVPGPKFRAVIGMLPNVSIGQFWRAVAEEAGRYIEDATRRGEIPLPDPIQAYEILVNIEEVGRKAQYAEEVVDEDTVYRFSLRQ
jgi:hypothetical protein